MKKVMLSILIICCVVLCGACDMDSAESEQVSYSENTAEIPFSHEYVYDKHFSEVERELKNLGFSNIQYSTMKMNYDIEENFDGRVVGVHFDDEWEFEEGARFDLDIPITISYVVDMGIAVPATSDTCKGLPYEEVVELFVDAGFMNVTAHPLPPDDTTGLVDGSVRFVSIDNDDSFAEGTKFESDAAVDIFYHESLPANVDDSDSDAIMVWISETGSKYHTSKYCSNMDDPAEVSKEKAETMGYTPCKKCH